MEADGAHGSPGGLADDPGDGGDHLPLLPEEVDELVVRAAALHQDVLGVV